MDAAARTSAKLLRGFPINAHALSIIGQRFPNLGPEGKCVKIARKHAKTIDIPPEKEKGAESMADLIKRVGWKEAAQKVMADAKREQRRYKVRGRYKQGRVRSG